MKTISHPFYKVLFCILCLIIGHYLAFKSFSYVGVSKIAIPTYGVIAFILIIAGILIFISLYFKLYYYIDRKKIFNNKAFFHLVYNIIGIGFIILCAVPYLLLQHRYYFTQIENYGSIQNIVIEEIQSRRKGSKRASFHFQFRDSLIRDDLPKRDYEVGDTATIIFSLEDPSVVFWLDDFNKRFH